MKKAIIYLAFASSWIFVFVLGVLLGVHLMKNPDVVDGTSSEIKTEIPEYDTLVFPYGYYIGNEEALIDAGSSNWMDTMRHKKQYYFIDTSQHFIYIDGEGLAYEMMISHKSLKYLLMNDTTLHKY